MKKTIIILLIIIILVGGLIYFLFFNKSSDQAHIIDKESIEQKDFLENKQAVLYFSSTSLGGLSAWRSFNYKRYLR